jgi:hypothetical protein
LGAFSSADAACSLAKPQYPISQNASRADRHRCVHRQGIDFFMLVKD